MVVSYLSNRRQRVVLHGISSSWSDVSSGVQQGSLLGPLFFVAFISDLPEVILPGSTIALYADDCKCSRIVDTAGDLKLFQQDLGPVSRKSRELFEAEKPFVKLRPAYSVKLVF